MKNKWLNIIKNNEEINQESLSKNDISDIVLALHSLNGNVTRQSFESLTGIPRSFVEKHFGSFTELKTSLGLFPTQTQRKLASQTAKHVSVDNFRELSKERKNWGDNYKNPNGSRFKTCIIVADIHDKMCDAFALRVLIDTIKRIDKLDNLIIAGDLFDLPEFSKYYVDPRTWDASGRIKFTHDKILKPLREAAPNVEMDLIEGNHEMRLLKQLCDNSPALMDVLNTIHGIDIKDIFGLDKFKINYVAKGSLAAWSASDEKKELQKTFKIYHDSFIVDHFPQAKNKAGMPGLHGHHHKYEAHSMFNQAFGSYTWHQIGGFHVKDASYSDGAIWSNGFMIAHVDTKTRTTNWEYVPISNFAVVGGKYYMREKNEFLIKE